MSVQVLDDIIIESDETPLNDMANLKLGSSCSSCENKNNNGPCRCTSLTAGGGRGAKDNNRKCTLFPYFWRKTQFNPFVRSSKKSRRGHGNFEILQPSKLSFISATGGGVVVVSCDVSPTSSLSSTLSSSSSLSININTNNNATPTKTLITSLPSSSPCGNEVQNSCNLNATTITSAVGQNVSSDTSSSSSLSTISPAVVNNSTMQPTTSSLIATTAFNIPTGTTLFQPSVSLPDFTSLSIKGMSVDGSGCASRRRSIVRDDDGENETTKLLLGKRTSTQRQMMTELNGAMLNFRLSKGTTNDIYSSRSGSSSRSLIKIPKWKSRIKCSYRTKALPPIMEDEPELLPSLLSSSSISNPSSTSSSSLISNSNSPNMNCSQQALMTMETGNRWNQDSMDPVDDVTIDELASYLDVFVYIGSKKMSFMAESMYT